MVAFEILVNGHRVRTITAGEYGILHAEVLWIRVKHIDGTDHEDFRMLSRGLEGSDGDAVGWPHSPLKVGDAVTIRIIDADSSGDEPSERASRAEVLARHKSRGQQ